MEGPSTWICARKGSWRTKNIKYDISIEAEKQLHCRIDVYWQTFCTASVLLCVQDQPFYDEGFMKSIGVKSCWDQIQQMYLSMLLESHVNGLEEWLWGCLGVNFAAGEKTDAEGCYV